MLPRRLWLWAWVLVGSSICSTSRAAQLYWIDAGRGAIQRSNTDGTAVETVVTGPGVSGGIAVDAAAGWIYWSQSFGSTGGSIQRSRLDGSDRHTIIADQTDRPIGVAVNPGSGELFWTTTNASGTTGSIRRSASDGTSPQTVYQGSLRQPFGITLDPTAGVVFWSDVGNAAIQRSNFDGSGFQTLIASGLMNPRAITLDPVSQTLFWTDNLATTHADYSVISIADPRSNGQTLDVYSHVLPAMETDAADRVAALIYGVQPGA